MFGRRYRFKSVEATLKELKYVASVSKATKFIVDDNFAANKRRTKEILRGMIAEGIKTRWSAQVRPDVARDPELLRLMADSGCHTLYIGFESINPGHLKSIIKNRTGRISFHASGQLEITIFISTECLSWGGHRRCRDYPGNC